MKDREIPVYLFTGFLESGKTTFIQDTLQDGRFNAGEKTLLLVCEAGEEDYLPDRFSGKNVTIRSLDGIEDLTEKNLDRWAQESGCERVIIEYKGMWQIQQLYDSMPNGWMPYQNMLFFDGNTFLNYNANMRSLVVDKLQDCELCVFNRLPDDADTLALHKIVRGVSRRADIVYEYNDGKVVPDEMEDPLPFDLDAPALAVLSALVVTITGLSGNHLLHTTLSSASRTLTCLKSLFTSKILVVLSNPLLIKNFPSKLKFKLRISPSPALNSLITFFEAKSQTHTKPSLCPEQTISLEKLRSLISLWFLISICAKGVFAFKSKKHKFLSFPHEPKILSSFKQFLMLKMSLLWPNKVDVFSAVCVSHK